MDIISPAGLTSAVKTLRFGFLTDRAKRFIPLAGGVLLFAGCATTGGEGLRILPAKVATLEVQAPKPELTPENNDIVCRIQMIDGAAVASSDRLKPGHHRLIVSLGTPEGEFAGDVDLIIPAAKDYQLKAEREDDSFTISLVEADTALVVATSSAPAAPVMSFQVFVMQK